MNALRTSPLTRLVAIYNRRCNTQSGQIERRWHLLAAIKREIIRRGSSN